MKHFFVIPNYSKERTWPCACKIRSFLMEHGAVCEINPRHEDKTGGFFYTDVEDIPAETECIIVLGGDGTLIQAVHDLKGRRIPIIGVNLGSIGYLAEVDEESLFFTLEHLLDDEYVLEERMTLEGEVIREGEIVYRDAAFNDIILSRSNVMKMMYFSLYVNGQFLSRYAADGMIAATPTGSTAYSISAGGPIVMPSSYLFVLTPICPHTLINAKSIVLPKEVVIELEVESKEGEGGGSQCVNFDANTSIELKPQDRVRILCGRESVRMIRMNRASFLETLRKKLN